MPTIAEILGTIDRYVTPTKRRLADLLMNPRDYSAQAFGQVGDNVATFGRNAVTAQEGQDLARMGSVMGQAPQYRNAQSAVLASLLNVAPIGATYYRRTNGKPDTGVGYMMFADSPEQIERYGKNQFVFDDASAKKVVDATDKRFLKDVIRALRNSPELESYGGRAAPLAREANPASIVDSAGLWDAPDLVNQIIDKVIKPQKIQAVRTSDGAIVFTPSLVKKQNHFPE